MVMITNSPHNTYKMHDDILLLAEELNNGRTSLRDQFAMAALTGILASGVNRQAATEISYKVADDMIKARETGNG